jgi:hypothetical protein
MRATTGDVPGRLDSVAVAQLTMPAINWHSACGPTRASSGRRLGFDTAKDRRLLNHQPLCAGAIGFDKLNPSDRNVQ